MTSGLLLIVLGALCGGSFGLPSKFVRKGTPWETLWGPFFFFATLFLPLLAGPALVKNLFGVCGSLTPGQWIGPVAFGFLWGLGSMTLGLSFAFVGLSLAYAINYGVQIAFGMIVPALIFTPGVFGTAKGAVMLAGAAVCILGVVVSGKAALLKEQGGGTGQAPRNLSKGIAVAVLSGVFCACYALAFGFGGDVMKQAAAEPFGNPGWRASFAVTALALWGGSLSACGYCAYKLTANKTWGTLVRPGILPVYAIALVMALLHDGAIACFGVGCPRLGTLGVSVGYAIFMSLAIFAGTVNGFLTGEWRGADARAVKGIRLALAILVAGVCVLAYANAL
ncbi:MAG: L-rhamnose/proton symporter RhaT [bacterium]